MGLTIVPRERAPAYSRKDYPYIQTGFIQANYPSAWNALETFYRFNNETTNVISQFIGLAVFLVAFMIMLPGALGFGDEVTFHTPASKYSSPLSMSPLYYHRCLVVLLFADIIVSSFSLACHLWQAWTLKAHFILSIMDWGGTGIAAIVSCVILDINTTEDQIIHEGLFGYLPQGKMHLLCSAVSLVGLIVLFATGKTTHAVRFYSIFVLGIFIALPQVPTFLASHSPSRMLMSILGFLIGGTLFSTHFPEVKFPKTFDLCCSSHTLWHCGYLIGLYQAHAMVAISYLGHVPWEDQVARWWWSV